MSRDIDALTRELRQKTDQLIDAIGDRSFFLQRTGERRRQVREITGLYGRLVRAPGSRRGVAAAAAASAMLIGGMTLEAQEPEFNQPQPNQFGLSVSENTGYYSVNSLADIDGDGDLDFFSWDYEEDTSYGIHAAWHENVGSARTPRFVERRLLTDLGMPHYDGETSAGFILHNFADMDSDGDLDAIGFYLDYDAYVVEIAYVLNTGSRRSPRFAGSAVRSVDLSLNDVELEYLLYSRGVASDIDDDGDLDILIGVAQEVNWYEVPAIIAIENRGSRRRPEFGSFELNPFGLNFGHLSEFSFVKLDVADLDRDGDDDLVLAGSSDATENGAILFLENTGTGYWSKYGGPLFNPFGFTPPDEDLEVVPQPVFGDLDGDGDLDMIYGVDEDGVVYYAENLSR